MELKGKRLKSGTFPLVFVWTWFAVFVKMKNWPQSKWIDVEHFRFGISQQQQTKQWAIGNNTRSNVYYVSLRKLYAHLVWLDWFHTFYKHARILFDSRRSTEDNLNRFEALGRLRQRHLAYQLLWFFCFFLLDLIRSDEDCFKSDFQIHRQLYRLSHAQLIANLDHFVWAHVLRTLVLLGTSHWKKKSQTRHAKLASTHKITIGHRRPQWFHRLCWGFIFWFFFLVCFSLGRIH